MDNKPVDNQAQDCAKLSHHDSRQYEIKDTDLCCKTAWVICFNLTSVCSRDRSRHYSRWSFYGPRVTRK